MESVFRAHAHVGVSLMTVNRLVLLCIALLPCFALKADELIVSWGEGSQPHADQRNTQFSLDYNFHQKIRSARSNLSFGVSYMSLKADTDTDNRVEVFSIYPQLTLIPTRESLQNIYFFVRALGPSYISNNSLGDRRQDKHFSFQNQVGFGYAKKLNDSELLLQVSWKHLSNANLFKHNDGFDIPLVLSIGVRY